MIEPKDVNYIDFEIMRKMCHPIAMALFDSEREPMTVFGDHDRNLLESALANPKQTFDGKDLYPTIEEKAAILYYSLIKNHPFENGNKRTATATLIVFLNLNNYVLREGGIEIENYLVDLATRVAKSEGSEYKNVLMDEIANWLSKNINQAVR